MTQPGTYTFVPWFRQGVAAGIAVVDDPAATATGRATISAAVNLTGTPLPGTGAQSAAVAKTLELVGPGDVNSLKTQTILRVYPPADSRDATPGELAYVEFYDEDIPWRYTPARPNTVTVDGVARPRLRPWLALFVLTADEVELSTRTGGQPVLTVSATATLPPPDEAWAWAHAQLTGTTTAAAAGATVAAAPNAALSRLMSPRHLDAGTRYTAFVVPAFETGRLAGLGEDTSTTPTLAPSWGGGGALAFPIYYSWAFTTGTDGSFESYVRKLSAFVVDDSFGKRNVTGDLSEYGIDTGPVTFEVEGALQPPEFSRDDFTDAAGTNVAEQLQGLVDLGVTRLETFDATDDDPGLVPPVYGRWPAGVVKLADVAATDDTAWLREANLDLRGRAGAGLGAQVVRDRQDELVTRAWDQVDSLHDANQRLREGELSLAASTALFQKHFAPVSEDELFLLSAAGHHGLPVTPPASAQLGTVQPPASPSMRAAVGSSIIPSAVHDGAFKRATRPTLPLLRQATGSVQVSGFRAGLVTNLNTVPGPSSTYVSSAPPLAVPAASISLDAVSLLVTGALSGTTRPFAEPKHVFWVQLVAVLTAPGATVPTAAGLIASTATAYQTSLNGGATDSAVTTLINAITSVAEQPDGTINVAIANATFIAAFDPPGAVKAGQTARQPTILGKSGNGVTVVCDNPAPTQTQVARFADDDAAADYQSSLGLMATDLLRRQGNSPAPPELAGLGAFTAGLHGALLPADTIVARVTSALPGFGAVTADQAAARQRRLQQVMAYPTFPDPMVNSLQQLDREYVLPNLGDLPDDSLTLMSPNGRFIEAFFAGLNTQMARELLWQEYPTDQRGSYFRVFWSHDDAIGATNATDVNELAAWTNALGSNGSATSPPLVLVVRSELLRKFPNTVVYAQAATFVSATDPRHAFDPAGTPIHPTFHASLDPDVSLIGFDLTADQARGRLPAGADPGDPGMFFVLSERPGQLRFGLDEAAPSGGLNTWDDLSWPALIDDGDHITIAGNTPAPIGTSPGVWGATAADMATILFRSPVVYARHASNMLRVATPAPPATLPPPATRVVPHRRVTGRR